MVVEVAVFIAVGELCIYDSHTNSYETKKTDGVCEWEVEKIDDFFKNLQSLVKNPIKNLYICLGIRYYNDIRKQIVQISKSYNNIDKIHLISNIYMGALSTFDKCIKNDNKCELLWIFCPMDGRHYMVGSIWEINRNKKEMTIIARCEIGRTSLINRPSKIELIKLKKELESQENLALSKLSNAYVLPGIHNFDENEFKEIFCNFNKIYFDYDVKNPMYEFLYNLQNLRKNFTINEIIGREIVFCLNHEKTFYIPLHAAIPFKEQFEIDVDKDNSFLKIYEDAFRVQRIKIKNKCDLVVTVIANNYGIYEIKLQAKNNRNSFRSIQPTPLSEELNEFENKKFFIPPKLQNYDGSMNAMGIDFGTSECCAFVIRKDGPEGVVLDDFTAKRTMPSYISVLDINTPCGQVVVERMENNADITVYDIKRFIGKKLEDIIIDPLWPFKIISRCGQIYFFGKGWDCDAVILCSFLIKNIKKQSEKFQSIILEETVITVPLSFTEEQRDVIMDSATRVQWKTVHLLPEPIAAFFGYAFEKSIPNNSIVLVFDCGGATTDICIAKILNNGITVLGHISDNNLGGRDFDKLLINYFDGILKNKYRISLMDSRKKYRLVKECNEIKYNLTVREKDKLDIDIFEFDNDDIITVTREEFEDMAAGLIVKSKELVKEVLTKTKLKPADIDIVLQLGGGCRMPMIKKMLFEVLPKAEHRCSINPEWITAKGASLHAYSLKQQALS